MLYNSFGEKIHGNCKGKCKYCGRKMKINTPQYCYECWKKVNGYDTRGVNVLRYRNIKNK